ncbi:helix-turn-helix transcriptional regulator [Paenibacillus plantarum]|nr:helix-turn-helix transcriptional regulator [Paenibacillus plantarum]
MSSVGGREIACIFNYSEEEGSAVEATITELIHETIAFLRKHGFVCFETVLSSAHSGVKGINQAYLEAVSMLNQLKVKDNVSHKLEDQIRLSDALQEFKASNISNLVNRVTEYIELNYLDVNLNMTAIGDYFKMDGRQLSKIYKDHTGERIIDYLNKIRIATFKGLAATDKMTLADAAAQSGFASYRTFMRLYKKYEGTTPGQFIDEEHDES